MFHRAIDLNYKSGTTLEVTFEDGKIMRYDMLSLFDSIPVMNQLKDRKLFTSGRLMGYGVVWTDDIDISIEEIYSSGEHIGTADVLKVSIAKSVRNARFRAGISQKGLAEMTGINQADISRIERGQANPSINTLMRIAVALDCDLKVEFVSMQENSEKV